MGGGDALLATLKATLDSYESDLREYPPDCYWAFGPRLAYACRLAGGFRPTTGNLDRGELADLMAELVENFERYQRDVERRIKNVSRGTLPDGIEEALLDVKTCTGILWDLLGDSAGVWNERKPTAAERRLVGRVDYIAERLREHVAALTMAVFGFDDDKDDDGGQDVAA